MSAVTAKPRLLCVDDEPELLDNLRLVLRKRFDVTTANSGAEALALFDDDSVAPFDAVLSDMRMPEMTGAVFLTTLRQRYPDIPRLLLSGQSDLDSAIAAINDAKIFRFLTKPCPPDLLIESIDEAIQTARLKTIERDLLDRTLNGTVDMLVDVLGLISPDAADRAGRVKSHVHHLCQALERPVSWELDLAAMLSQLGFVAMPLTEGEESAEHVDRRVELAAELLIHIPRLESVAALVRGQCATQPVRLDDEIDNWTPRELNAEILRLAVRFDDLITAGHSPDAATGAMKAAETPTPPFLLAAVGRLGNPEEDFVDMELQVTELEAGMTLTTDLLLATGPKLAPAGMELTGALVARIVSFARTTGVQQPVGVRVPGAVARQLAHS